MRSWKDRWYTFKQPILNGRQQRWNAETENTHVTLEQHHTKEPVHESSVKLRENLSVSKSNESTSVTESPAENIGSKRPRTWGSMVGPIALAIFPTHARASSEGLPLRGAIWEKQFHLSGLLLYAYTCYRKNLQHKCGMLQNRKYICYPWATPHKKQFVKILLQLRENLSVIYNFFLYNPHRKNNFPIKELETVPQVHLQDQEVWRNGSFAL